MKCCGNLIFILFSLCCVQNFHSSYVSKEWQKRYEENKRYCFHRADMWYCQKIRGVAFCLSIDHYLKSQMKANDYLHTCNFHSCSIHGPSVLTLSVTWAKGFWRGKEWRKQSTEGQREWEATRKLYDNNKCGFTFFFSFLSQFGMVYVLTLREEEERKIIEEKEGNSGF